MLPAGNSVVYHLGGEAGRSSLTFWLNKFWSGCIFQVFKTESGEEFFLYKDLEAQKAWDKDGGTAENLNTMIQFIIDWDKDTVEIIGDRGGAADQILDYCEQVLVKVTGPPTGSQEPQA